MGKLIRKETHRGRKATGYERLTDKFTSDLSSKRPFMTTIKLPCHCHTNLYFLGACHLQELSHSFIYGIAYLPDSLA